MDKPGGHRTGLNAHFGVDTSVLRNTSRNWPGIGGADAAPEPLALLVDNADRGRLLRYVQPNIMRHRNLRWCKSPGNMPGSRHYRCLRLRTAITRGPHHQGGLAREAAIGGDPVAAENLYQHAEHYFRINNASRDGAPRPTMPADAATDGSEQVLNESDIEGPQPGWGDDRPGFV